MAHPSRNTRGFPPFAQEGVISYSISLRPDQLTTPDRNYSSDELYVTFLSVLFSCRKAWDGGARRRSGKFKTELLEIRDEQFLIPVIKSEHATVEESAK